MDQIIGYVDCRNNKIDSVNCRDQIIDFLGMQGLKDWI
jgi:hypothetical protein